MTQTIFVTGASSGIGKATAKLFNEKGWNVVATMRHPENEDELTKLDNVLVERVDVTDSGSIATAISAAIEKFGGIDVLLNNAGYGAYGPLEAFSMEKIRRQFDTNVIGLLAVTQAVLPYFRAQTSGTIVNVSSVAGKLSFPLGTLYHGSKHAVEGISESLQFELDEFGAKVKIVEPGAIGTDFSGRSFDFTNDESMEEYQPLVKKMGAAFEAYYSQPSPPTAVAEIIYQAATDGTNRLRYPGAGGAKAMLAHRRDTEDEQFSANIKQQFGL